MKNFFKSSDFLSEGDIYINTHQAEVCADEANALLNKAIEAAPTVCGINSSSWGTRPSRYATHTAKLMFIEELVKEPCEHRPSMCINGSGDWTVSTNEKGEIYCSDCMAPLNNKAVWSEK